MDIAEAIADWYRAGDEYKDNLPSLSASCIRTGKSLELEVATGEKHCSCCLAPTKDCAEFKYNNRHREGLA